jgi:hypothetical protein
MLKVQKKAWVRESNCWQAGGARGGSGGGGATWRSAERASVGREEAARVLGRHVALREAA